MPLQQWVGQGVPALEAGEQTVSQFSWKLHSGNSCILSKCFKDPSPSCDTGCLQVTLASCNLQYYTFTNNIDTCFLFFGFFCLFFLIKKSQRLTRLINGSRNGWRCHVALSVALHKQPLYLCAVSVCLYWCISSLLLQLRGLEASTREKIAWVEYLNERCLAAEKTPKSHFKL